MPTYGPSDAQASLTIQEQVVATRLTAATDKTTYQPGETVQVSGALTRTDTGAAIDGMTIRVESSWGEIKTATTGSAASASCLGIGSAAGSGAYCLTMTAPAATGSHVVSVTFSQTTVQALAQVMSGPSAIRAGPGILVAGGLVLYLLMAGRGR